MENREICMCVYGEAEERCRKGNKEEKRDVWRGGEGEENRIRTAKFFVYVLNYPTYVD